MRHVSKPETADEVKSLRKRVKELEKELEKAKALSGMLCMCASCRKIRDGRGYWNNIERYIEQHTKAVFSHGICPDCAERLYPDYFTEKRDDLS